MANHTEINLAKLSATLRTKRGQDGLRAVATEIGGVSASTLSRIEQGSVPDLDSFMRICRWLGMEPSEFLVGTRGHAKSALGTGQPPADTPQMIEAHLRADRVLPPETINALSEMIRFAYKAANEGKLGANKGVRM